MKLLENGSVELKSHKQFYDISLHDGLEKSEVSFAPNIYETQITSTSKEVLTDEKEKTAWVFQYRYLVVTLEFFLFFQINCLRQVTSVSLVAMVNTSEKTLIEETVNASSSTCPMADTQIDVAVDLDIEGEFDWSPSTQGYILGAGFLGYFITQMPGGMLADAFGAKYIITFGLVVSSFCHLISPFLSRLNSNLMMFAQLMRGIGQGFFPVAHCVVAANWFPRSERGLLNTLAMTGYGAGALVGGIASGAICASEALGGWSFSYYLFGCLGILFSGLFYFVFFETPKEHPNISEAELKLIEQDQETDMSKKKPPTPWRPLLCSVPVWALVISMFPQYWMGTYMLSVHPTFLGTILHINIQENGVLSSLPFVLQTLFTVFSSWFSNWLQKNNVASVNTLRKGFNFLCYSGYFVSYMGMYAAGCNKWLNVGFIMLIAAACGLAFAGVMIAAVDLSPRHAGSVMGLASTLSSTAGFILPFVVGLLTNKEQTLDQWNQVFFLCAGINIVGIFVFTVFGSAEVQYWNFETMEEYENYKASCDYQNKEKKDLENTLDSTCHL